MSEKQQVTYWACGEPDFLTNEDMDEAIEEFLDEAAGYGCLPATIVVKGYARLVVPMGTMVGSTLDDLLEGLDEEYGNPDGEYTDATENMKKAAKTFVEAVVAEYEVWQCETCETKTINVAEWVRAHAPQWLTEDPPVQLIEVEK